jgi:hypothetical protein
MKYYYKITPLQLGAVMARGKSAIAMQQPLGISFKRKLIIVGVVAHACNSYTLEAGGL